MELIGKVVAVLPLESGVSKTSGKQWQKATIIVEYTEGQYPKKVAVGNRKGAETFAKIPIGAQVIMQVEVTSREYNGRWYTSCDCWKWEVIQAPQPTDHYAAMGALTNQNTQVPQQQAGDNLPF